MEFRKYDVLDELTQRYVSSCEILMEKVDVIGDEGHAFLTEQFMEEYQKDRKKVKNEVKEYRKYNKKLSKLLVVIEKINLVELSEEEFEALNFIKRHFYVGKEKKLKRKKYRFWKWSLNHREYVPEEKWIRRSDVDDITWGRDVVLDYEEYEEDVSEPSTEDVAVVETETDAQAGDAALSAQETVAEATDSQNDERSEEEKAGESESVLDEFFSEDEEEQDTPENSVFPHGVAQSDQGNARADAPTGGETVSQGDIKN